VKQAIRVSAIQEIPPNDLIRVAKQKQRSHHNTAFPTTLYTFLLALGNNNNNTVGGAEQK
jgi:hypothetical protein